LTKLLDLDASRRDALLNAALKEFSIQGYDNASTNVIAKEAGFSKALMFHYVGSKQELFLFTYDYFNELLDREYFSRMDYSIKDIFERLRTSYLLQIELMKQYPWIIDFNKLSAKNGTGIDELLENILLVAEMQEYKANPNRYATGAVIESKKDNKVGSTATLLIQNGTLRLGDPIVIGNFYGKVRTLKDDRGNSVIEAKPSTPVEVTGISEVPSAGDKFMSFESEKQAKEIARERALRSKEKDINFSGMTLEDLFGKIQEGVKEVKVVLKADVNGSLEAVKNALEKISIEGVRVNVIRGGVGAITESDVVLASASNAIIIGFNVRGNNATTDTAKQYGIEIKTYDIIYKVVEDMEQAMKGLLDPEYEEKVVGTAEIRQLFKFSKVGLIAGCHVTSGIIKHNLKARIVRDDVIIYNGSVNTLQHEKDQVKEVKKDMDCGITLENCQDYKEGDIIEVYELVEVKR